MKSARLFILGANSHHTDTSWIGREQHVPKWLKTVISNHGIEHFSSEPIKKCEQDMSIRNLVYHSRTTIFLNTKKLKHTKLHVTMVLNDDKISTVFNLYTVYQKLNIESCLTVANALSLCVTGLSGLSSLCCLSTLAPDSKKSREIWLRTGFLNDDIHYQLFIKKWYSSAY